MTTVTQDSIALRGAGTVHITQPAKGARFTMDSLLLADFCRIRYRDRVLEPGAGTGIISLFLARKYHHAHITAVEFQTALASLCRVNIEGNGLQDRITLIQDDIRNLRHSLKSCSFDAIVANPPYMRSGTGKNSASGERLSARHDGNASLSSWLDLRLFLKNKGRYVLVFSASRAAEVMSLMRQKTLEPKRVRFVHPRRNEPAALVLIEAVKSAGVSLEVLPPLYVHGVNGAYSDEMQSIYGLS